MREFRPAGFRPDKAGSLEARINYCLDGSYWNMKIKDGKCAVEKDEASEPHIIIRAEAENLVAAALARAPVAVGRISRIIGLAIPAIYKEDFEASATGIYSMGSALIKKRIRIEGDKRLVRNINKSFWHFWQRTRQAEENIKRFSYLNETA